MARCPRRVGQRETVAASASRRPRPRSRAGGRGRGRGGGRAAAREGQAGVRPLHSFDRDPCGLPPASAPSWRVRRATIGAGVDALCGTRPPCIFASLAGSASSKQLPARPVTAGGRSTWALTSGDGWRRTRCLSRSSPVRRNCADCSPNTKRRWRKLSPWKVEHAGDQDVTLPSQGCGSLFGLAGVSFSVLDKVIGSIRGRLLVVFPGRHAGGMYRLLDVRNGWNYHAVPIPPDPL